MKFQCIKHILLGWHNVAVYIKMYTCNQSIKIHLVKVTKARKIPVVIHLATIEEQSLSPNPLN